MSRRLSRDEDDVEEKSGGIAHVQLDGLVLLKIIKHCKDHHPEIVTGQLLGLDVSGRLEITDSIPFPQSDNDEENEAYQLAMMKALRAVNADNNTVGWYQSTFLGQFLQQSVLEAQYNYQKAIPSSVLLVYDPVRTTDGHLHLRAYRLTDTFMRLFGAGKLTKGLSKLEVTSSEMLEEIPIKVHNSHLIHGFLYELRESKVMSCDVDRLHLDPAPYVDKNLAMLTQGIDEFAQEQSKYMYYLKSVARQKAQQQAYLARRQAEADVRRREGKEPLPEEDLSKHPLFKALPAPSRLEALLIESQLEHYSKEINSTATEAINKLYVVDALHKTELIK